MSQAPALIHPRAERACKQLECSNKDLLQTNDSLLHPFPLPGPSLPSTLVAMALTSEVVLGCSTIFDMLLLLEPQCQA